MTAPEEPWMPTLINGDVTPEDVLLATKTREELYKLGQFFTPNVKAEFMPEAALAGGAKTVLDPAAGGGGLLRAI
jgi:type I restriction-modification system DNA methylase subunit